ncbi:MAG: putative membrane protein YecN with MAPEG domain [Crocinitomicaceae bacterium]|jgi:uncharacterized membrane protein YecN with MAPEG domain
MPMLPITSFYTAILALLILKLAFNVIKVRQAKNQGLGYSDNELLLAGRIHGNAMEYIPISLILLALAEGNGVSSMTMHAIGTTLVVARVLHAIGFKAGQGGTHPGRYWGVVLTALVIVILSICNILYSWHYLF